MNCCNFTGRLTRDPELSHTKGGTPVSKFSIAVRMRRNKAGEEVTEFIDMNAFGKTAETIAKYLKKGREIAITGEFRTDKWDDRETGQKRSKSYIVVNQFGFIGGNGGNGGGAGGNGANRGASGEAAPAEMETTEPAGANYDDDIPF